jgi:hypothetical protein
MNRATARRIALRVWLGVLAVEFVVWASIVAISGEWVSPWWLWTAGVGGLAVSVLWWLTGPAHTGEQTGVNKAEAEETRSW